MTNIHGRTNTEWTSEIAVKIAAVESDTSKPDYGPEHVPPHVLAKLIDHTLLKPDSTEAQIDQLCEETKAYGFKVGVYYARNRIRYHRIRVPLARALKACPG